MEIPRYDTLAKWMHLLDVKEGSEVTTLSIELNEIKRLHQSDVDEPTGENEDDT